MTNNDVVTRLYIDGDWRDVSSDVKYASGIRMSLGFGPEDDEAPPQESRFTLLDPDGDYNPRDPTSLWYGHLGLNTPCEQVQRVAQDTCGASVASGWGTTEAHANGAYGTFTWTTSGGVASDYNKASGKATHLISVANQDRFSWLATLSQRDVDFVTTLSLGFTDVTGGAVGTDFFMRGVGAITAYYAARVLIQTDESVTIDIVDIAGSSLTDSGPITVAGLTHSSGQALRYRMQCEGQTVRAKIWALGSPEPFGWSNQFVDEGNDSSTEDIRDAPGFVGIRSVVVGGNTNVPVTFSYDDIDIRVPLFFGEISEWPPARDVSGEDRTVPVVASGIKRRLSQGDSSALSTLHRGILSVDPVAYWPCEEGTDATLLSSGLPGGLPMTIEGSGLPDFAANSEFDCSSPIPNMRLTSWVGVPPPYDTSTGQAQTRILVAISSGGVTTKARLLRLVTSGTAAFWDVFIHPDGSLEIDVLSSAGVPIYDGGSVVFEMNGSPLRLSLELMQDGADVDWNLSVLRAATLTGGGISGTVSSRTFGRIEKIELGNNILNGDAVGHVTFQNVVTDIFEISDQLNAHRGETAAARMIRLCAENDIDFSYIGVSDDSAAMGPQGVKSILSLLRECAVADIGLLYESRGAAELAYRTLRSLYGRAPWATIDMSDHEFSPPWQPTDDDRLLRNKVTAKRPNGGSQTYLLETGPRSVLPPAQGGSGVYDDTVTTNVQTDNMLLDQAGWRVNVGTVDERRYPNVKVELHRTQIRTDNPTLHARLLNLDVGDQVTLSNMDAHGVYDDADQLVGGYERYIDQFQHQLVMHCTPASAYRVGVVDDPDTKLGSETSYLDFPATDSQTTLRVRSEDTRWTTDAGQMPIALKLGGEEVSATAIGSATPTFVAAGTAAHADNASVTPGLPAGLAEGDLLLLATASRSTSSSPNIPSGYADYATIGNFRLLAKVASSSEAAPTVTFTGTSAGVTCSAQMAAFRGASVTRITADGQSNASAQDIAFPIVRIPTPASALVLHLGWKQDDWTSVAALSGATEIGEPSSTLGDDQAFVWDYRFTDGSVNAVDSGSFVVTGGASAISIGIVVAFHTFQTFTVTRSVNGVVKAHSYDAPIRLARPSKLGL